MRGLQAQKNYWHNELMIIIYISGIDGCGKTTQSKLLVEWLQQRGTDAEYQWLRWEPSVMPLLRNARKLTGKKSKTNHGVAAKGKASSENKAHSSWTGLKSTLMSYSAFRWVWMKYATGDYFSSYKKARAGWNSDYIVMDRYIFDFAVDQSLNFAMSPAEFINKSLSTPLRNMQNPDYSIFINIPAEVGYNRKMDGTSLEYLKQREALYNDFGGDTTFHVDGQQSAEKIHMDIRHWIETKLVSNND